MKNSGAVAALLLGLLVLPVLSGTQESRAEATPPTGLKLVGDHWTPWDPPDVGADAYIIQKGDTLWDLSSKWLGDPYLWPQIWDENRYILDSHWIYPGDPLVVPGKPTVVPDGGPPPVAEVPDEPDDPQQASGGYGRPGPGQQKTPQITELAPDPAPLVPVASDGDLYCTGQIDPEPAQPELWVAGAEAEKEKEFYAEGDVLYMNHGDDWGVEPGQAYAIVRPGKRIHHPTTGQNLGTMMRHIGRLRVMLAQDRTATAVIEMSCEDVTKGDQLVPWAEIPAPLLRELPDFDRYDVSPSGGAIGEIVTIWEMSMAGAGNVVYTDLGAASGVRPGDVVTVYRDLGELPRLNLGQAVILTVEPGTSTAKLIRAVKETNVGDRVEVLR